MAEQLIISISGMRGIVGENLTPSIAAEYGCAFGTFLKEKYGRTTQYAERNTKSVCIGRDSRTSGQMLKAAVSSGLCASGIDVIDLGLVTTPSVAVMVKELRCCGGAVITASHNPIQYNGIKLLLDNGIAPPIDKAGQIKNFFLEKRFSFADSADCGKITCNNQADTHHIKKVLAIVDKSTIAARKFKVVLDSVNGAGSPVTKKLLAEFGCEVIAINDEPTGLFAHTPEPAVENVKELCELVKAKKADIGFAQDPDADRLAIVDENGTYIGEEYTLALAAKYIFSKTTGKAATNLSTSRMLENIAAKAGGMVYRTAVGEANVANAMLEHNCIIGGEGNGGVIDLRVSPVRDSLVGIALILQLMAETGKTVKQLIGEIGSFYMIKDKFAAETSRAKQILELAKKTFAHAMLNTIDGCRFDFDDGWLHIRPSNTEPVVRIIAEAVDKDTAQKYINAILKLGR
ncbi:MAG: phosphoglucosamine mutase [Sedimentisphaerales bacterium]|nr:phosphoglucosamine mutase [Sedimentisphaerales bacterium]